MAGMGEPRRRDDSSHPARPDGIGIGNGDGASSGAQARGSGGGEEPPWMKKRAQEAAQEFHNDVRQYFRNDEVKFGQFQEALRSWNPLDRSDCRYLHTKIKRLLIDNPELLERYNDMLPPESQFLLPPTHLPAEYPYLVATFVLKLKARFDCGTLYYSALREMFDYREGTGYIRKELSAQDLVHLLHDNNDMLDDFAVLVKLQPAQNPPTAAILPCPPPSVDMGDTNPRSIQPLAKRLHTAGTQLHRRKEGEGPSNPVEHRLAPTPPTSTPPIATLGPRGERIAMTNTRGTSGVVDVNVQRDEEVQVAARSRDKGKGKMVEESAPTDPPKLSAGVSSNKEMGIHWATAKAMIEYGQMVVDHICIMGDNKQELPRVMDKNGYKPPLVTEYLSAEQELFFREFYGDEADAVLRRLRKNPIVEIPKAIQEVLSQKKPRSQSIDVIVLD